jgi:hypothetical protein
VIRRLLASLLLAWCVCACGAQQQIRYVDMDSASHRTGTGNFHPVGSWDMKYSWDCARQHSENLKDLDRLNLTVYNADDDSTAFEHPELHVTGTKGGATLHYQRAGWYYATIESPCDWKLQVIDTSKT